MSEHDLKAIRWYAALSAMAIAAVALIVAGWQP